MLVREPGDAGGHAQLLEARHVLGDDAERERGRAALAEDVDAEAGQALGRVGDVEVAGLVELAHPLGRDQRHRLERAEQVLLAERRALGQRRDRPVRPQHRRLVELQVDVARAELDGDPEDGIEVHEESR